MNDRENTSIMEECILLVDDNPTNLQILLDTLGNNGYKLLVARSGEEALQIVSECRPVLMLLDVIMPGIDGYEVCRIIKNNDSMKNIAVIILSALNDPKDKVRGFQVGAVDYISKPFYLEEVIIRVETQLKIHRLERELSAKNKTLEADKSRILESIEEGILGLDSLGQIVFLNTAASNMMGWSVKKVIGKEFIKCMQSSIYGELELEQSRVHLQPLQDTLNYGVSRRVSDSFFWHSNSKSFEVSYCSTPIMEQGHVNGAVVVFRDITEEKAQQKKIHSIMQELSVQKVRLAHASRLSIMGEMAAGFAHEITQPITAISNYFHVARRFLLQMNIRNDELKESIDKIGLQASRAGEIIARIRSFVKKPENVFKRSDLNTIICDSYKLAEIDAFQKGIGIKMHLFDKPLWVNVDVVQIQQVILNLIRNGMEALKDAEEKFRSLGVIVETTMKSHDLAEVRIQDRGVGLPNDAEERIFTPFYTTKSDGMGIGLTVCYSIIESHNGHLSFHRHRQNGTIFQFTLPVVS